MSVACQSRRNLGVVRVLLLLLLLIPCAALGAVNSWSTSGPPTPIIHAVAVDPTTPRFVYAGTPIGVYRSLDAGATWQPVAELLGREVTALAVGVDGTVIAGTQRGGLFRSTNGGTSWSLLLQENAALYHPAVTSIALDPISQNNVYVAIHGLGPGGQPIGSLLRSSDRGLSWSSIDGSGLPSGFASVVALDPQDPSVVFVGTLGLGFFKSTSSGTSWTALGNALAQVNVFALAVDPARHEVIYAGTASGVFKSTDGGSSFQSASAGMPAATVTRIVPDASHASRVYASTQGAGVFTSTDAAGFWQTLNSGLSDQRVLDLALTPTGTFLHAATLDGGVFDLELSESPAVLSLNPSHSFSVQLTARDQRTDRTASGVAIRQSDHAGFFSLPDLTGDPSNPEVFVKILDGSTVNGRFWVFYGGLTDLEYTITIIEDATGRTKQYSKLAGSACGGFDTDAF